LPYESIRQFSAALTGVSAWWKSTWKLSASANESSTLIRACIRPAVVQPNKSDLPALGSPSRERMARGAAQRHFAWSWPVIPLFDATNGACTPLQTSAASRRRLCGRGAVDHDSLTCPYHR
jgi:hypothetical protein